MKKTLITLSLILTLVVVLFGQTPEEAIKSDIEKLLIQKTQLEKDIEKLIAKKQSVQGEIGKEYLLKIELRQIHYSLDLEEQIADGLNEIVFELPVSKSFYNQTKVGTKLLDDFREGSLLLKGSLGSWHLKVVGKRVK
ncbi:MAG: hypothetical protein PHE43_00900 [Candidatus Nanoarchaeia archaeon]|nr:hypothetical protein [Candidatus Nanoarchaeia archaeon]